MAAAASKKTVVTFTKERETPNTVRYQEVVAEGDPALIRTLYIQKFAAKDLGSPESIKITIEAA